MANRLEQQASFRFPRYERRSTFTTGQNSRLGIQQQFTFELLRFGSVPRMASIALSDQHRTNLGLEEFDAFTISRGLRGQHFIRPRVKRQQNDDAGGRASYRQPCWTQTPRIAQATKTNHTSTPTNRGQLAFLINRTLFLTCPSRMVPVVELGFPWWEPGPLEAAAA